MTVNPVIFQIDKGIFHIRSKSDRFHISQNGKPHDPDILRIPADLPRISGERRHPAQLFIREVASEGPGNARTHRKGTQHFVGHRHRQKILDRGEFCGVRLLGHNDTAVVETRKERSRAVAVNPILSADFGKTHEPEVHLSPASRRIRLSDRIEHRGRFVFPPHAVHQHSRVSGTVTHRSLVHFNQKCVLRIRMREAARLFPVRMDIGRVEIFVHKTQRLIRAFRTDDFKAIGLKVDHFFSAVMHLHRRPVRIVGKRCAKLCLPHILRHNGMADRIEIVIVYTVIQEGIRVFSAVADLADHCVKFRLRLRLAVVVGAERFVSAGLEYAVPGFVICLSFTAHKIQTGRSVFRSLLKHDMLRGQRFLVRSVCKGEPTVLDEQIVIIDDPHEGVEVGKHVHPFAVFRG